MVTINFLFECMLLCLQTVEAFFCAAPLEWQDELASAVLLCLVEVREESAMHCSLEGVGLLTRNPFASGCIHYFAIWGVSAHWHYDGVGAGLVLVAGGMGLRGSLL